MQVHRRLAPEVMHKAVQDYLAGMSAKAVGQKYGINAQTVLNNLKARGIPARPANSVAITHEQRAQMVELRAAGMTLEQISDEFGISKTSVRRVLSADGRD